MSSSHKTVRIRKNSGYTFVELLVTAAISLIVLSGILTFFTHSLKSSHSSLKAVRLNQELRVIMDVMVRDIRRAGYWSQGDGISINPFSTGAQVIAVSNGNCLIYSYDSNSDNVIDNNDNQGFKLVGNSVTIRKMSASCDEHGGRKWESISDKNTLKILGLHFELKEDACLNLTNSGRSCRRIPGPDDTREPGMAGDVVETMYVVGVTLTGALKNDLSVVDVLKETVSVRNTFSKILL